MNIEQTRDGFKWEYLTLHENKEQRSYNLEIDVCPHLADIKREDRLVIFVSLKTDLRLFVNQKGLRMNVDGAEKIFIFVDEYLSRWKHVD